MVARRCGAATRSTWAWVLVFAAMVALPARANGFDRAFGAEAVERASGDWVTTEDLLSLRDLGSPSLSPDGVWIAFSLRQPTADRDDYDLRWFVARADGSSAPVAVDAASSRPLISYGYGLPYTTVLDEPAAWSPDGRQFAFRRRVGERIELWVAPPQADSARKVGGGEAEVTTFAWLASDVLGFRTGLNVPAFHRSVEEEARVGWRLDGRMPLFAARLPAPTRPDCTDRPADASCENAAYVVVKDAAPRLADAVEARNLDGLGRGSTLGTFASARLPSRDQRSGARAWAQVVDAKDASASDPVQQVVTDAVGAKGCVAPACRGAFLRQLGWADQGRSVWFLKGESSLGRPDGAPRDLMALYIWEVATGHVRQVFQTTGQLDDCRVANGAAYCLYETQTSPRRIVSIDLADGALRTLVEPNPRFSQKSFPKIRKLQLDDGQGNPAFAYVVYPYGYQEGRRYPLVVTQYDTKGFLRGQVGGVFPIFPLAAEGYLVLSVDRPEDWSGRQKLDRLEMLQRGLAGDLKDRRSTFAVNESAVDQLIAEGLVDPARMALTGVSAGAENVHFTLQRTGRYAAAIADSGVHDLTFFALVPPGPKRDRLMARFKSSTLIPAAGSPIRQLAWSEAPARLTTPLLINTGSDQALLGFEGLQALVQAGRPIEIRVFPGEMHIVYRPRTLLAVQENNLDWLSFWLLGKERDRPTTGAQYRRWRAMQAGLGPRASYPPTTAPWSGRPPSTPAGGSPPAPAG